MRGPPSTAAVGQSGPIPGRGRQAASRAVKKLYYGRGEGLMSRCLKRVSISIAIGSDNQFFTFFPLLLKSLKKSKLLFLFLPYFYLTEKEGKFASVNVKKMRQGRQETSIDIDHF